MTSQSALFPATPAVSAITLTLRRLLFPGFNLHARERYWRIPQKFGPEIGQGTTVLDAGCGNGMLAYRAWKRGAKVIGVSIKQKEIAGCRSMFNEARGISTADMHFDFMNLMELATQGRQFDAIICTEVLEHIRDDRSVCAKFFQLLKPGGCLHVTSPNAAHPHNSAFPLDLEEGGGHVRAGYTAETYRDLLEPVGFAVEEVSGLGGRVREAFNQRIITAQERFGAPAGVPLFLLALPFLWLDSRSPRVPFCLYVRARKRRNICAPSREG